MNARRLSRIAGALARIRVKAYYIGEERELCRSLGYVSGARKVRLSCCCVPKSARNNL